MTAPIATSRALLLLTGALARRLLREGMVVRSLVFPIALITGTLLGTLAVASVYRGNEVVALTAELEDVHEAVRALGLRPVTEADPAAAIVEGRAWAGSDGRTFWVSDAHAEALALEAALRLRARAPWVPRPREELQTSAATAAAGRRVVQIMALLFSLYGVVFGAGMIVRDRDAGTLEAEMTLPVPHQLHIAARWLAGTAGISAFYALGLLMFHALLGVPDLAALLRHGFAATATSTAVGLLAVGWTRGGGFSGPLAAGLSLVTGLVGVSYAWPPLAPWLPLASVASHGQGWAPLAVAALVSAVAIAAFPRRSLT